MKGKILLLTGLAVGYVLGTRAGRERYDEIKDAATKLWNDPRVQKPVKQAEEFVKDTAPEVVEFVSDGVKTVTDKVTGKSNSTSSTAKKSTGSSKSSSSSTK
jgi:hypothetical protein